MSLTSLPDLLSLFRDDARVARIAEGLQPSNARVQIAGTIGSSQALIAASVIDRMKGVHVFVLTDKEEAAYFINDLEALRSKDKEARNAKKEGDMLFYPAPSRSPYDPEGHHDGERVSRTEVLEVLMKKPEHLVIVTYPEALVPLVVGQETLVKNTLTVKRNEELPIDTLEEWLLETGFSRVEFVYEPGQFSVRGGIVDVFSYGSDKPYRIELYGDNVESVRRFDPQDQLTVERLAEAVIVPDLQDEDAARQQLFFAQLPENATIWLRDLQVIGDAATKQLKLLSEAYERLQEKDKHTKPSDLLATDAALIKGLLGFRKVFWASSLEPLASSLISAGDKLAASGSQLVARIDFQQRPQPTFAKEFKVLSGDLHNKQNAGYTNLIACNSAKQSERLYSIFNDMEHEVAFTPLVLDLHEGFIDPELKLALYT
ncbi:MAG: hypothetical protein KA941_08800, partial [Flavobacteriales bacterium]|nr:hypothetical protein [Flavobacteriales bacterium]